MLFFLLAFLSSPSFAHDSIEGFGRIRGADCQVKGFPGKIQSVTVSFNGPRAKVRAYSGSRNPVDPSVGLALAGEGDYYSMVGFPSNADETISVKLDPELGALLQRPNLVVSAKIKNANEERLSLGYLANPLNEDEDITLLCTMFFEPTAEHLDVINEEFTQKSDHPSMCRIEFRSERFTKNWTLGCTASVVGERTLLSAGHCEESFGKMETRVQCGPTGEWRKISRWVKNPAFRPPHVPVDNSRDISVIELDGPAGAPALPIEYSTTAVRELVIEGNTCVHYGAGRRQDDSIGTVYKSAYHFPKEFFGGKAFVRRLFDMASMITADPENFLRNGDSGGPLVCEKDGREVVVGVNSFHSLPAVAAFLAMPSRSADFLRAMIK